MSMPRAHAVVWLDHHAASIHQFDADSASSAKLKAHEHETRQHNSGVRAVHEFFGDVCDALSAHKEVLITGSRTTLSDFKHYVEKHRPQLMSLVAGYEAVDHPTDGQLIAFARTYFAKFDNLKGTRPLA
jgi:stalled ribosome rescue protein Dom34